MNKENKPNNFCQAYCAHLLCLILCLGACLRIYNLGSHNFWYDEVMSFYYLSQTKLSDFIFFKQDQLYSLFLHLWSLFFGKSEFALRSLSTVFGVFSIPLIYKIGRLFFDRRVGLAGALILAISPIHIWYSQEARGYTLSTFLTMAMVYFLFLAAKKNKLCLWIGFVLSSSAALYTNYFCFYVLIATGALFFLKNYRHLLWRWIASMGFIFVAFLPLVPVFVKRIAEIRDVFWIPKPPLILIAVTFRNFNAGYNATPVVYFFTSLIFSSLFILGIYFCWKEKKHELITLCFLLFIPIIFTFLVSQITPVYLDRQLMLFSPFYYIIIAVGLISLRKKAIKIAVYCSITLLLAFCLNNYYALRMPMPLGHHIGVYLKKPVKPAADYISKGFMQGDVIGYSGPSGHSLFYYLWDKIINEKIDVYSFIIKSKLEPYWRRRDGVCFGPNLITKHIVILDDEQDPYKKLEEYDFKRLWLISSTYLRDGRLEQNAQGVRDWMQDHYAVLDRKEFDGMFIDLYGSNKLADSLPK